MSKRKRLILGIAFGLLSICIISAGLSAYSNRNIFADREIADRLTPLDKARLSETLHLKQELGPEVWPGWDQADIPFLLWTEEYSFLIGYPGRPEGWGLVDGDTFEGRSYYRQPTESHQNFAVLVDGQWAASLASKWEMDNFIINQFKNMIPSPINKIIPYKLFIQPSEVQMTGVLHESFHVYQALTANERLEAAEERYQVEDEYWRVDESMRDGWKDEVSLLVQALDAESEAETIALVSHFLARRDERRANQALSIELIDFERLIEWEEGLAKYLELAIWQQAFSSPDYQPLPEMVNDPDFKGFTSYKQRWSQEILTMRNQASREGDTRFYYTGMAQGFLLDRLMPDWKSRILTEDLWLEDLLRQAIEQQ